MMKPQSLSPCQSSQKKQQLMTPLVYYTNRVGKVYENKRD